MNSIAIPFKLRRATDGDAETIADLFFASYRLLTFLPMLHTIEGYRRFVASVMLKECAVTVVEDDTCIISFLAQQGEEVRQLYTRPDCIGRGAGTQLIEAAKLSGVAALELWCFQANARARRFLRGARLSRYPLYGRRTTRSGCPTSAIGGSGKRSRREQDNGGIRRREISSSSSPIRVHSTVKSPTVTDGIRPESEVRNRLTAGGRWIRTLGPRLG
jgi:GNAT superfamily N-acetyltransferase